MEEEEVSTSQSGDKSSLGDSCCRRRAGLDTEETRDDHFFIHHAQTSLQDRVYQGLDELCTIRTSPTGLLARMKCNNA